MSESWVEQSKVRDEREDKLPRWAQEKLAGLRNSLESVESDLQRLSGDNDPDTSFIIVNPYDDVRVGLGKTREVQVRRKLDLPLSYYGSGLMAGVDSGGFYVRAQERIKVIPQAANVVYIDTEDR